MNFNTSTALSRKYVDNVSTSRTSFEKCNMQDALVSCPKTPTMQRLQHHDTLNIWSTYIELKLWFTYETFLRPGSACLERLYPRPGRISYPSIDSHKLNKSSMEFARGLSPCCARFGNLYFYVVPVTVTRAHIHGDACATRCRAVFFFFSFFFSYHPIATYVTFCSFRFSALYLASWPKELL